MFKLQSPSSALHLMQYTYQDVFPLRKTCLLMLLPFSFHLFHIRKTWGLFSFGETKKSCSGQDWGNGEGGKQEGILCLVKNCRIPSVIWAGVLVNYPIMKWASAMKECKKKNLTEAECSLSQQCQLAHWYRCVPRTLT